MNFFVEYLKHPRIIGAVLPSGKNLARQMVAPIHFDTCRCIVEYGPGTGVFTDELARRKKESTRLLVIEQNANFCAELRKKFKNVPNVFILHGDAGRVEDYLKRYGIDHADYIVSGLPIASLPKAVAKDILNATRRAMGRSGSFITFQYTLLKKRLFTEYFRIAHTSYEVKNFPPAYVLTMQNDGKKRSGRERGWIYPDCG